MKKRRRNGLVVNLFLVFVIAALYALTSSGSAMEAMAALTAGPVYRGSSEDAVALEFAVSWDAAAMPDILDTLAEKNARATFAVSGEYARLRPDMVKRIHDAGHELATMGDFPSFDGDYAAVCEDLAQSLASIEEASGISPVLYYSGERGIPASARASRKLGLTQMLCTVDLRCAAGSPEDIVARGLNEPIIGSIILMQPTRAGADALAGLIDGLSKKGIGVVAVSEVIGPG
ncbi:MAG: Polysaccharide deacetylase [Firmicutes bacterium ADurb.Bin248]|nr:MAG: Polysaccharide deacetylase [Firmicutes bacterium ADurb.Bin248]HOF99538.1 polysaccharide deacetylase family protein [Clostridia bacterium]HPK15203.1 polysaccharide deacetylase family protein [Clostridia bacterium]